MNESKHRDHRHGGPESDSILHGRRPYWKSAHRDWRFLVAVFLMLTAMVVYVLSDNLSLGPRIQPQQPLLNDAGE